MTEPQRPAVVIYAAKSTEDKRGSIPDQIEDCRALAEREGWEIIGEGEDFVDEKFTAVSGNRGPGLERAKGLAIATAAERGSRVLVAQDADRFARGAGDAPGAADHLGEVYFAMKRQRVTLWSVRSGQLDLLRAALEGERSTGESDRKSGATKSGLKRRKERGQPVGPVPLGYRVEGEVIDGRPITRRTIDPATRPTIERIFAMVEAGATFGDVARALNAEGVTGRRGKPWISRTVRTIVHNAAYKGEKGYPAVIDAARWQAIHDGLKRLDPVAVQRRAGGRKPVDDSYFLRGIVFCRSCGGALYTRRQAAGRMYVCSNRRQGTGLCSMPPIPARLIEGYVLAHLDTFVGGAKEWLIERVRERDADRERHRAALDHLLLERSELDRRRVLVLDDYDAALAENDSKGALRPRSARTARRQARQSRHEDRRRRSGPGQVEGRRGRRDQRSARLPGEDHGRGRRPHPPGRWCGRPQRRARTSGRWHLGQHRQRPATGRI